MKRTVLGLFLTAACLLSACSAPKPKQLLVLTERTGWHAQFTAAAIAWLKDHSAAKGYAFTEINNTDAITPEFLADFDAILQLDYVPYAWTDAQKEAFEDYIDNARGGWIGFHHATLLGDFDGYKLWPWFSEFMGDILYQNYNAELSDGTVVVEDVEHPVMKGVSPRFVIPDDEWYIYNKSPRPKVRVLAHVDEGTYTIENAVTMGDHPVVWVNENKPNKNVYFQMGHSEKLLSHSDFVTMLSNAIIWVMNL